VPDFDLSNSSFDLEWWIEGTRYARVKSPESSDGFAYVCEECGTPWAYKYFPNRALIKFYGACPKHPSSRGEVPGSLILWWVDELDRLPPALVEREYQIHLTHYERECHERDTLERKAA
jgi:hypothetical protein